jgi:hypothetical protein
MFHAEVVNVKVCYFYLSGDLTTVQKNVKLCYNFTTMNIRMAAELIVSVLSIIGSLALGVRWMVKHYLSELRPNSGSSIKDQVNRLEQKVEIIYDIILSNSEKPSKRKK